VTSYDGRQPDGTYRQLRFTPPPQATELLLVRHGESQRAVIGQPFPMTDGRADPELAPEGVEQAGLIAARLAGDQPIDAIYVTSLRRTAQTAAPLAQRLGLVPIVERDLREVGLGEWEGGTYRKMVAENGPLAQRMHAEERWDVIPGAEPSGELASRVRGAIERMAAAHPGQRLAVFIHGGIIGQILALATGSRRFAFVAADNGSISELVVAGDHWTVRRYNDTSHLDKTVTKS
jgi:2,3-bisphosphoglycerate-dependent phosphoglycerate mutase